MSTPVDNFGETLPVQPPAVDEATYAVHGTQYPHWAGKQGYTIVKSSETSTVTWRIFYTEAGRVRFLPGYDYSLKNARARADSVGDLTEGE